MSHSPQAPTVPELSESPLFGVGRSSSSHALPFARAVAAGASEQRQIRTDNFME
jgi:hypothetical protein